MLAKFEHYRMIFWGFCQNEVNYIIWQNDDAILEEIFIAKATVFLCSNID